MRLSYEAFSRVIADRIEGIFGDLRPFRQGNWGPLSYILVEVLGVSGLMGAGRTEIMKAIFGDLHTTGGKIYIDGKVKDVHNPVHIVGMFRV